MKTCLIGVVAALILFLAPAARPAAAQDPCKVAPKIYKSILDNEHVRVCEIHFKPGDKIAMHAHPDHVVYITSGGKLKLSYADGSTKDMEGKPGDVIWIKAESHQTENVGTTDVRGIVVELRDPAPKAGEATQGVPAAEDPLKVCPEQTKVLFENNRVRVLDAVLKAGGKLAMHSHPPNVAYAVVAAKVKFTGADGKATDKELPAGGAMWSDAVKHAAENIGTTDAHVLNFELKQPAAEKK